MKRAVCSGVALLAGLGVGILLAGPLDPPAGPVASTHKTLSEVEPRIAISSANTPGDGDSVFRITQPGSYYLTGNVTGAIGKSGIEIAASNISIDLNGFALIGVGGSLHGVTVGTGASIDTIAIHGGTIRGWGGNGVSLSTVARVHVKGLQVSSCVGGIVVGHTSVVRESSVQNIGGDGISVLDLSVVRNCHADACGSYGVRAGLGLTASDCVLSRCATGLTCGADGMIRNTIARSNTSFGFNVGAHTTLQNCAAMTSGGEGFVASSQAQFIQCRAEANGQSATRSGFFASDRCSFHGCTSTGNSLHGYVVTDGASFRGCDGTDNGGAGIAAGNGCHIESCLTRNNQQDGIVVNYSCAVIGNNCNGDGAAAGAHGAIKVVGQANRIEANNITYADRGLYLTNSGNAVVRNTVKGCTVNFDIVGGNDVGPIGGASTATSPWANIQY